MELNDLIFLAAAAFYATSTKKNMSTAVMLAKMLWAEVLKQDREDS